MRVRAAGAQDHEFIARAALLATHDDDAVLTPVDVARALPHHARYFDGWPKGDDFGVIAEDDAGSHIGAAWCRVFRAGELEHSAMTPGRPELIVAVEPRARRSGVGTRLVLAVLDVARDRGAEAVELTVGAHRPWLVEMYQRSGFAVIGRSGRHFVMRHTLQ